MPFPLGTFPVQEQLYNKVITRTSQHIFTIEWPAAHMFQIFPFYKMYQKFQSYIFFSQNLDYGHLLVIRISPEPQESNRKHNNENMRDRERECVGVGREGS